MLDFNRFYYEETCGYNPFTFSRFETKPGKNDNSYTGPGLPKTFQVNESNADEKRTCVCRLKNKP